MADGAKTLQRKRGRPSKSQSLAVEAAILAAARELFSENGFSATSMEAIATSAGVAKATLYGRYPTKPDLFRAIARASLAQTKPENLGLDRFTGSLPDYLFHFGVALLRGLKKPEARSFYRLITGEQWFFPELADEFFKHNRTLNAKVAEKIVAIEKDQHRSINDAERVAEVFIGALTGWFRGQQNAGDISDDNCNAFVARLVTICIGGRTVW